MEELLKLLTEFHKDESAGSRGPRFVALAYAIERRMHDGVSRNEIAEWLGPPDLTDSEAERECWIYRFDHLDPGLDRDQWYFFFNRGQLANSAFNRQGINDLSDFTRPETHPSG
jgi:hypothetical protein